jgi:hypothetical protein
MAVPKKKIEAIPGGLGLIVTIDANQSFQRSLNISLFFFLRLLEQFKESNRDDIRIAPIDFWRINLMAKLATQIRPDRVGIEDKEILNAISDWKNLFYIEQRKFFDGVYLKPEFVERAVSMFDHIKETSGPNLLASRAQ